MIHTNKDLNDINKVSYLKVRQVVQDDPEEVGQFIRQSGHADDQSALVGVERVAELGEVGRVDVLGDVLEEAHHHEVQQTRVGQGLELEGGAEQVGDVCPGLLEHRVRFVEQLAAGVGHHPHGVPGLPRHLQHARVLGYEEVGLGQVELCSELLRLCQPRLGDVFLTVLGAKPRFHLV